MLVDNELWAEIQRLRKLDRLSERDISSQLKISRGKVRRYLKIHPAIPKPKQKGASKLDPFKPIIHEILEKYPNLSIIRFYEKLQPYGCPGKKTILRDYLAQLRQTKQLAYVRYETAPGEEAQVDWGFGGTIVVTAKSANSTSLS
jgi:transposase